MHRMEKQLENEDIFPRYLNSLCLNAVKNCLFLYIQCFHFLYSYL